MDINKHELQEAIQRRQELKNTDTNQYNQRIYTDDTFDYNPHEDAIYSAETMFPLDSRLNKKFTFFKGGSRKETKEWADEHSLKKALGRKLREIMKNVFNRGD